MKLKSKALIIIVFTIMTISILALCTAIVLVAKQANISNGVTITYSSANNVMASIVASGKLCTNAEDTTGSDIQLTDGTYEKSINISPSEDSGIENISYTNVELSSNGRAEYIFEIKNEVDTGPDSKDLKMIASIQDSNGNAYTLDNNTSDNIVISMLNTTDSPDYNTLSRYMYETNEYYYNIGTGGNTITFIVCVYVDNPATDITNYSFNIDITLGYDLANPNDGKDIFEVDLGYKHDIADINYDRGSFEFSFDYGYYTMPDEETEIYHVIDPYVAYGMYDIELEDDSDYIRCYIDDRYQRAGLKYKLPTTEERATMLLSYLDIGTISFWAYDLEAYVDGSNIFGNGSYPLIVYEMSYYNKFGNLYQYKTNTALQADQDSSLEEMNVLDNYYTKIVINVLGFIDTDSNKLYS